MRTNWWMFHFSPNLCKRTWEKRWHPSMFCANFLVSFCRHSEERNHHGSLNSCGVLNNLDILHHETNQQEKEKVRTISVFLQLTWLACVLLTICLSVSWWCFYTPALETSPGGNLIFKIARFTLNARRFLSIMWLVNGVFSGWWDVVHPEHL